MICITNYSQIAEFCELHYWRLEDEALRKWLVRAVQRYVLKTEASLRPASDLFPFEIGNEHVVKAQETGQPLFRFMASSQLAIDFDHVIDWVAGLEARDPGHYRRINRISFAQAIEASKRWHTQMARRAEKLATEGIPDDPENAPTVLEVPDLGEGWHWVWMRTPIARELEGAAMGHCVGSGGYESLINIEGIFSLRDGKGIPHVTLHLNGMEKRQAVTKGNKEIPDRYTATVDRATAVLGVRLFFKEDPAHALSDGRHSSDDVIIYLKDQRLHRADGPAMETARVSWWFRDGVLHREDGPAEITEWASRWYFDGKLHRDGGPAIEYSNGHLQWYKNGKLLRSDGPAEEFSNGFGRWWLNGKHFSEEEFHERRGQQI